ncbi:uncharacterized protein LOC109831285 [Asparagus officinalis]|uniref:uncharacterized protein LOC109831285 n=1 Tax=Asparagus officinalis TaxID=4686 RepID=UPI00098E7FCE|nr:uncharacterized protein LOC109831285 [Asparagus officinalis]
MAYQLCKLIICSIANIHLCNLKEYFFICNVRINTIMDNQKWRYRGCPNCFRKTIDAGDTFWCAKCDIEVFAENSYRITMEVQDESVKTTFVVMNKEAEKLVKIPAQEVARTIKYVNGREVFPEVIKAICGKCIKVQVKLTRYNFVEGNEGFIINKVIEETSDSSGAIEFNSTSQESVDASIINLLEDAPPPTLQPIASTKSVVTPMHALLLDIKSEKVYNKTALKIANMDKESNEQKAHNKRKRSNKAKGKENDAVD